MKKIEVKKIVAALQGSDVNFVNIITDDNILKGIPFF